MGWFLCVVFVLFGGVMFGLISYLVYLFDYFVVYLINCLCLLILLACAVLCWGYAVWVLFVLMLVLVAGFVWLLVVYS